MPRAIDPARFVLRNGEQTVLRDQILRSLLKFDQNLRGKGKRGKDTQGGWFISENGKRYPPKWILGLATDLPLGDFRGSEARKTLSTLGFDLEQADDEAEPDEGAEVQEQAAEMTFGIERDLQAALRLHIEQLEKGLRINDGGKERVVDSGRIDITAEDKNGATVVIELKAGEAGRHAIGQILAYMGDLADGKKPIRGILVAKDFSLQAIAAARVVLGFQLRKYSFKFAFETVGSD